VVPTASLTLGKMQRLIAVISALMASGGDEVSVDALALVLELSDVLVEGIIEGEVPVVLSELANSTGITVIVGRGDGLSYVSGNLSVIVNGPGKGTTLIEWAGTYPDIIKTNEIRYDKVFTVKGESGSTVDLFLPSGMIIFLMVTV